MEIIVLVYAALAYWAMGETVYRNKIRFGPGLNLFLSRLIIGMIIGVVII